MAGYAFLMGFLPREGFRGTLFSRICPPPLRRANKPAEQAQGSESVTIKLRLADVGFGSVAAIRTVTWSQAIATMYLRKL